MAKQGMRRYKPGDGMDSDKKYGKNEAPPVPEIQGKARESKEKSLRPKAKTVNYRNLIPGRPALTFFVPALQGIGFTLE